VLHKGQILLQLLADTATMAADTAPKDPHNLVLYLMYYMAIGTLLPWNFFINVNGYWMYKFRTTNTSLTAPPGHHHWLGGDKNQLQLDFTSDLAIAAMIPNVAFLILNGLVGHRFRTTPRLLWSLCVVVLLFISTLVCVRLNTDHWQSDVRLLTLVTGVIINVFTAIFQGGLIGLAGAFPSHYMTAVLNGQGIGGVFAATINIALLALGGNDDVSSAFYCFLLAIMFLAGSWVSCLLMSRTDFYKHHIRDPAPTSPESAPLLASSAATPSPISVVGVLGAIRVEALTVLTIYIVTLGCFPALTVLVETTQPGHGAWQVPGGIHTG
jgi:equilibrative nucleoside transporter 1/2/3